MTGVIRKIKGKDAYFLDGKQVTKRAFDAAMDLPVTRKPVRRPRGMKRGYPIKSVALGVHPDQVPSAREQAKAKGVPTDFTPGGRPILRDAGHRKRYLKAFGFHDRNSYYGY